jgi:hypothetical protein
MCAIDVTSGPSFRRLNRLFERLAAELPEDLPFPRLVWYTPTGRDAERERQRGALEELELYSPSNRRRLREFFTDEDERTAERHALGELSYQRHRAEMESRRKEKFECLKPMIIAMLAEAESLAHIDGVRTWCAHNKVAKEGRILCDERAVQIQAMLM